MPIVAKQRMHFGPFELDAHAGELYKHGLKLKLQGHPIQILAMLLERPGELITREEIQQALWPSESETFVDFEHGLNTAMRKLRQALGDDAETPKYIETLPRRGYRFVGEIPTGDIAQAPAMDSTYTPPTRGVGVSPREEEPQKRPSYRRLTVLVLLPVLLAIAVYVVVRYLRNDSTTLVVTGTRQLTFNDGVLGLVTGVSAQYGSVQTDGRRVYYTVFGEKALRYISVNGGEESKLPSPVENPVILHISPNGSTLIVREVIGSKGGTEGPLWLVEANGGAARKLGDIEGQDAAFAPDGKSIGVAIGQAIYLTDIYGTAPAKLAEVSGRAFWLRWSPDGSHLRFSIIKEGTAEQEIWDLNQRGELKQVLAGRKRQSHVRPDTCCGIWTKDGKYFLFRSGEQYWAQEERGFGRAQPVLVTTSGTYLRAATADPLANTLYVNANLETEHSIRLDERTKQTSLVYPDLQPISIEYSADGRWVVYLRKTAAYRELWRARVDGSERRQLTGEPMWVYMARISPDGTRVAFMAKSGSGPLRIYWVSMDGGEPHEVPSPVKNSCDPNWSPDGNSIMFGQPQESWREPGVPRHIYVYDLHPGKVAEIEGSLGLFSPRWSPNGRYVAAMRTDFHGMSLLDRTTGKWRVLAQQSTDEPFWSPDSLWIYFQDFNDTTLFRVSTRGGEPQVVMNIPLPPGYNVCNGRSFTPDGSLMLNCRETDSNIFALDLK